MTALLAIDGAVKRFARRPTLGERIAGLVTGAAKPQVVHAVTDVTLALGEGEWLGLVGESGCGKSTLGRIANGVYVPDRGSARFRGETIAEPDGRRVKKRTTRIQMIHQDPFASLDPRMRIGDTIAEGPIAHRLVPAAQIGARVADLLGKVGLDGSHARRLPHQFSGGQRQRVAIARALAMQPEILVCDEPVASLDVSVQAQVLNLFLDLRREFGLAALFISHDLGVVRHVCDRIAIMYLGRIVEEGPARDVTAAPAHPYTRALMEAVPRVGARQAAFKPIAGEIPSPLDPPPGCAFHPRCPLAVARCRAETPPLRSIAPGRQAACHLI